jgi:hypothetical protein
VYDKSPWNFGFFDYFTELKPKYVVAGEFLPKWVLGCWRRLWSLP